MKSTTIEAKTKEEALRKATESLNASESEIIYSIEETKGGLFKSPTFKITASTLIDLTEEIKKYLKEIISPLGLDVNFESTIRERKINIGMYADNNAILIGKNGQTIKALENLAKQKILNKYNYYINLNLDVENYKEKRIQHIESLAKRIAREVRSTKVEVALENMNSYERRIVHNVLTDFKGVKTESVGEEPDRHVIIKPTED